MSKASNIRSTAAAVALSAAAPVSGPSETSTTPAVKAPVVKQDRKVVGGDAYNRLVAAGAMLIVLASKGKLFSTVLSQLGGPAVSLDGISARIAGLTKSWPQFDRGYLVGPAASYGACAVASSSKKPKGTPAFTYAVPASGDRGITLMTADGQVWNRPEKSGAEQSAYDLALSAATAALTQ